MLHLVASISVLIGGVTHLGRRRDPPGFWEHVERTRGEPDPWAWQQESGVEWWLVGFALVGLVYIGFLAKGVVRRAREKRVRRRRRTIHPIPEAENPARRFKDYRRR
jgi:hypothetical protein